MQRRFFAFSCVSLALAFSATVAAQPVTLRVMTHSSFSLPKEHLAQFEKDANVRLQITKGGDAGEMLNKLILTRRKPVADVVYGIDNTLLPRAMAAGILDNYTGPASRRKALASMGDKADANGMLAGVVPVDYGYVNLNIDKAWFANKNLPLPTSLQDLTKPTYNKLLVVQNPATSSTGQAFLLATIAGLGEQGAFNWWKAMRANGVKVAGGWSDAYYKDFSKNGGTRPIVVSYATSPAAEVFYSKEKITASPTANLFLDGAVFRQVEGVALLKGGNPAAREAAAKFIEFLRTPGTQRELQTSMWMYPAEATAKHVEVLQQHAEEPKTFNTLPTAQLHANARRWLQRWNAVVLK
ncbi:MAG: thiamine ABC transporter substrate-binding protein [Brachymonas sp.]|nr:thiamine ABC transporter substrate-binding protein [Brachymonas sp.]